MFDAGGGLVMVACCPVPRRLSINVTSDSAHLSPPLPLPPPLLLLLLLRLANRCRRQPAELIRRLAGRLGLRPRERCLEKRPDTRRRFRRTMQRAILIAPIIRRRRRAVRRSRSLLTDHVSRTARRCTPNDASTASEHLLAPSPII